MQVNYDADVDVLYLKLSDAAIQDSEEIQTGVVIDWSATDEAVGVEIRNLKHKSLADLLEALQAAHKAIELKLRHKVLDELTAEAEEWDMYDEVHKILEEVTARCDLNLPLIMSVFEEDTNRLTDSTP